MDRLAQHLVARIEVDIAEDRALVQGPSFSEQSFGLSVQLATRQDDRRTIAKAAGAGDLQ